MGLSNYPSSAEGMLPAIVINTVLSVTILKNLVRTVLQVMGCIENPPDLVEDPGNEDDPAENMRERRISVTMFKSLSNNRCPVECCVCLHGFEAEQEVSELSCKHVFHKSCLEKWLDHKHVTCPLCRSAL